MSFNNFYLGLTMEQQQGLQPINNGQQDVAPVGLYDLFEEDGETNDFEYLSNYITNMASERAAAFKEIAWLQICKPIIDPQSWTNFAAEGCTLIEKISSKIKGVEVVKAIIGLQKSSGENTPQPASSESLSSLKAKADQVLKTCQRLQQLINLQTTFWKMEDDALKIMWDGTTMRGWIQWYRFDGISERFQQLDKLFKQKMSDLSAKDIDLEFCQTQKKSIECLAPVLIYLEQNRDLQGDIKDKHEAAEKAVLRLKEIYEKEADTFILTPGLDDDKEWFKAFNKYYLGVRNVFNQLIELQEEISAFNYIYYHSKSLGAGFDVQRLEGLLDKINVNENLIKPNLQEDQKLLVASKLINIKKMEDQIVKLQIDIEQNCNRLKTDYCHKGITQADVFSRALSLKEESEVEGDNEQLGANSFKEDDFIKSRSQTRVNSMELLTKIAGLIEVLRECVFNKHQLEVASNDLDDIKKKFTDLEILKNEHLRHSKIALEEVQARSKILTNIVNQINPQTIALNKLLNESGKHQEKEVATMQHFDGN
jgi:hypothetical protein